MERQRVESEGEIRRTRKGSEGEGGERGRGE